MPRIVAAWDLFQSVCLSVSRMCRFSDLFERFGLVDRGARPTTGATGIEFREPDVRGVELRTRPERDRAFDHVAQLADIPGPAVGLQLLERRGREALDLPAGLADEPLEEVVGEDRDVGRPIAQRRHIELHDLESEEEVAAERARAHGLLERPVGRGDDAHVGLDRRVAADALERMAFQHAEELRLRRERHLADLVEEDRPLVGRLELADHPLGRAGERALLVAEEFAFQERLGECRAVDADERSVAARAGRVDRPGDEFLADAALAANEHRCLRLTDARDLRHDRVRVLRSRRPVPIRGEADPSGSGSRPRG